MEIRTTTPADVPDLRAVYDPHTTDSHSTFHTEPVPPAVWDGRITSDHPGDHVLVAVDGGRVLGTARSTEYRAKEAYGATRETSVHLAASGRGLGRALYDDLLGRLTEAGMHTAVAAVALPNDASVRGLHDGRRSDARRGPSGGVPGPLTMRGQVSSSASSRRRASTTPAAPITTR